MIVQYTKLMFRNIKPEQNHNHTKHMCEWTINFILILYMIFHDSDWGKFKNGIL